MEISANFDQPVPPLRPTLEAVPIEHEGKQMILLRDTEEFTDDAFVLTPAGMLIASYLDGRRNVSEIRALFAQQTGAVLKDQELAQLLQQMEQANLLDTPAMRAKRDEKLKAFLEAERRPAVHVKGGYPGDRLELIQFLTKFFTDPKGPGKLRAPQPAQPLPARGLIAPHIDFHRGGPAYAWAYGALADHPKPDIVVALGVAHSSPNSPWVMTKKEYETPLGTMKVHGELYNEIQSHLWYDAREEELVHRREHSLEFQAVWLKYLWGEEAPPWVPILTSTFERWAPDRAPSTVENVERSIEQIGTLLRSRADRGEKILILAGVDFAHVGPRFGDNVPVDAALEKRIEEADQKCFPDLFKLQADPFYLAGIGDHSWRKVCGLSAMYTAQRWLKALGAPAGRLLTYGQAPDPLGGIVSFASIIY